jgi:hypothetical protein
VPPAVDLVRPAALQRTPLLADPPATLHLLDSVDRLVERLGPLVERLHRELGLGVPDLAALRAVAAGADPDRDLAALRAAGLVDGGRVTELGRVRLAQAEALQVRVADVVTAVLGPADAGELARLLDRLAAGLPGAGGDGGAADRPGDRAAVGAGGRRAG